MKQGNISIEFRYRDSAYAWKYVDALEKAADKIGDGRRVRVLVVRKYVEPTKFDENEID